MADHVTFFLGGGGEGLDYFEKKNDPPAPVSKKKMNMLDKFQEPGLP